MPLKLDLRRFPSPTLSSSRSSSSGSAARLPFVGDVDNGELNRHGEPDTEGLHGPWRLWRRRRRSADSLGGVALCRRRGWSGILSFRLLIHFFYVSICFSMLWRLGDDDFGADCGRVRESRRYWRASSGAISSLVDLVRSASKN